MSSGPASTMLQSSTIAIAGLATFVGADLVMTVLGLLAGFPLLILFPTVVGILLVVLTYRGSRLAWIVLIAVMAVAALSLVSPMADAFRGKSTAGLTFLAAIFLALGFAIYAVAISSGAQFLQSRQNREGAR